MWFVCSSLVPAMTPGGGFDKVIIGIIAGHCANVRMCECAGEHGKGTADGRVPSSPRYLGTASDFAPCIDP